MENPVELCRWVRNSTAFMFGAGSEAAEEA